MSSLEVYDPTLKNTLVIEDIKDKSRMELTSLHPSHLNVTNIQKNIGSIKKSVNKEIVLELIRIRKEMSKTNPPTFSSMFTGTRKKKKAEDYAGKREALRKTYKEKASSASAKKVSSATTKVSSAATIKEIVLPDVPSHFILPAAPTHSIILSNFPPQKTGEPDDAFLKRIKDLLPPKSPTISISRKQLIGESDAFHSLRMDYLNNKKDITKKYTLPSLEKLQGHHLTKAEIIDFYSGIIAISKVKDDIVFAGSEYGRALKMMAGGNRRQYKNRRRSRRNKKVRTYK
jgi:hypothetical protein